MLFRSLIPLLLLYAKNQEPIYGRTRFQKVTFLAQRIENGNWYKYIPHKYGPYAPDLQNDLLLLTNEGYIKEEEVVLKDDRTSYKYSITDLGITFIESIENTKPEYQQKITVLISSFNKIKEQLNSWDLDKLIRTVYKLYPEYTGKSIYQF